MSEITIFLSCVPDEFHHEGASPDHCFRSWGKVLEQSLNGLKRDEIVVVTQETALDTEYGDSLEILEKAIKRSDYVIHLCGRFPGDPASGRSLQLLRERSPDFLSDKPEMRRLIPDWSEITSTQWELYFAWQHNSQMPLIYCVDEEAPRSPVGPECELKPEEKASQERHREVIKASGQLCPVVSNQDHLARLVQTFLLKEGEFEQSGYKVSKDEVIAKAKEKIGDLVRKIGRKLNVGVRGRVLEPPKTKGRARLEAVEAAARSAGISARELMELLDEHNAKLRRVVEEAAGFDSYYELAFLSLTIGEYGEAIVFARSAAELALKGRVNSKTKGGLLSRNNALDALVLLHDLAILEDKREVAIEALQEGSRLWVQKEDPLGWAHYHLQLADYLHDSGDHGDLDRLLWGVEGNLESDDEDGVLDIYEEHFGKEDPEEETELKLARAVHLTARVKNSRGSFSVAIDLARRARRIYEHYGPLAQQSVAHCLMIEEEAFESLGDLEERMESDQEALEVDE